MKILLLLFLFINQLALAEDIDQYLKKQIQFFSIKPIPDHQNIKNRAQVELGKRIFISPLISGNKNVSCMTCHNPKFGSSDGKMLGLTQDGKNILRRNSPSLFNTGLPSRTDMFHDGRVSFNSSNHTFKTPEENFNGSNPKRSDITNKLNSALSMQTIFPMVSNDEMRGNLGDNEIANAKTNVEAWSLIVKRITDNSELNELLKKAYPNENDFNIGHIGEALGQFIREEFYSNGSPFNRYLKGEVLALTPNEKNGLKIFIDRGKCIACHQGGELGLANFYASVGVPQFGAKPSKLDLGRAEVSGFSDRKLFFKTPSLLNLAVTAPYMHNGAYQSIRDVINHYSNIKIFLSSFDLPMNRTANLPVEVEVLNDPKSINDIFNSIQAPFLRNGLNFSEDEKDDLEAFLTNGLLDPKFKNFDQTFRK